MSNKYIDKASAKKAQEKSKSKKEKSPKKAFRATSRTFTQIMNGEFLVKDYIMNNLGYVLFVVGLLVLLVGKSYYVNQITSSNEKTQKEVDQMNADFVEAKAELEERTRRAELTEKLNPRGLKETLKPTSVIRQKKEEK